MKPKRWKMKKHIFNVFLYLMHIYVKANVWVYYNKSYTHSFLEKESLSEACH